MLPAQGASLRNFPIDENKRQEHSQEHSQEQSQEQSQKIFKKPFIHGI
jgi:hypothetical protein